MPFYPRLFAIAALCISCRSSGSAELARYAGAGAAENNGYLEFYARAPRLSAQTQIAGKIRAYMFAAMQTPDLRAACGQWDCLPQQLQSLSAAQRSPLFGYAAFHLAELAASQSHPAQALQLLALIEEAPQALKRRASLLRGKLLPIAGAAVQDQVAHWEKHAAQFEDAESLYFAAHGFDMAGQKAQAQALAWKALEKPEADFPFSQSGILLRNMLGPAMFSSPTTAEKIRLMEALRVGKDRVTATRLMEHLHALPMADNEALLFAHYRARLQADKGDFSGLLNTLAPMMQRLLQPEHEKAALDICERLLKKKQYKPVARLFSSAQPGKSSLQCRLRLAQRTSDYSPAARRLARDYITLFDPESTLAERIFLRSCLPSGKKQGAAWNSECLAELRTITAGKALGAGARYFLVKQYDRQNKPELVRELLAEIAANYSDDYYFFRLIEYPVAEQKRWAATFKPDASRAAQLLAVLLHGSLTQAGNLPDLTDLAALEKEIHEKAGRFDGDQKMALLLLAAESREEMRELLRGEERPQIYSTLAALGLVAQKPDIALYGVKQYIRDRHLRPFLFEIPPKLRDMLYPRTYGALVEKYAAQNQLEQAEVFALIRQESQFFAGAISVARAQGLMQVLPSTGRLLAAKEGLKQFDLLRPEDNIRLGTAFMRDIRRTYAADFTALGIAYNAGPGRLRQWQKKYSSDDDIFVEEIPFQETYHYIRILLADRARYRALLASP